MTRTQKQIQENFKQLEAMKKQLGIRPRMEVTHKGGKTTGTFDLRTLNQSIIKK